MGREDRKCLTLGQNMEQKQWSPLCLRKKPGDILPDKSVSQSRERTHRAVLTLAVGHIEELSGGIWQHSNFRKVYFMLLVTAIQWKDCQAK